MSAQLNVQYQSQAFYTVLFGILSSKPWQKGERELYWAGQRLFFRTFDEADLQSLLVLHAPKPEISTSVLGD